MRHALEGCRLVYIAQSIQHEPLDQTDLKNSGDAILKEVENRHNNEADSGTHRGRAASKWGRAVPHVRDT